jgi:hypothetical protein
MSYTAVSKPVIRECTWWGYRIVGNKYHAIAVDIANHANTHYFTIDPDVNNDAFVRAQGWAYQNHELINDEFNTGIREL